MNTPDDTPKDGDYVAYLAELEKRQLQTHAQRLPDLAAASSQNEPADIARVGPKRSATALGASSASRIAPVGLAIIGFAFLIAGFASDGGIFLILIGVFLIWQAARAAVRKARAAEPGRSVAAERIATLLAAHAQRKKSSSR